MKVREAMTAEVIAVSPSTALKEVAELLVRRRISGVPVVEADGTVVGVVSEADFVAKEAGAADEKRSWLSWMWVEDDDRRRQRSLLTARTAGEAMSKPAVTIDANRPLSEAAHLMERSQINRLPVLDDGKLVGIISRADIVRAFARSDDDLARVASDALRAVDSVRVLGVNEGVVSLGGTVPTAALAHSVRRLIEQIDGVVGVEMAGLNWPPAPESSVLP